MALLQCLSVVRNAIAVNSPVQCNETEQKSEACANGSALIAQVQGAVEHTTPDSGSEKKQDGEQNLPMT